jgi:L-rhamnose isomerase/sugar isomerase
MIDQCHNLKPKIEEMIQSVENIQKTYAKALIVDRESLKNYQQKNDIVMAEKMLNEAFETNVMPLLFKVREGMGLPLYPLEFFRNSGYINKLKRE